MANGGRIDFTVGFKTDSSDLQNLKNQLNEISKLSSTQIQSMNPKLNMNEAISAMQKVRIAIEEIKPALDKSFDTTTGVVNLQKLQSSLQKLNLTEIQNRFNAIGPQGQQAFLKISKAALTTNVALKETSSFLDKMGTTFINTLKWGVASSVMNNFTGAVQQAYGYVQHLDTSLNDIRIVTEKSADEMDKFAVKANNAAKSLGQSTTAYTEAALIYYQQGLSDEESQARAETTLKAANVTGQTGREVSEQLTAVWNGYKVTAEETELYVDKLAAVAASTASDLEELSTGMSKVASAANNMGVDIDQLNAQLATIVSVTRQAPETAGTALKTIYARMEDLKIGGEDESGVKLGEVSSTLEAVGISVMDTQGDLRDLGEVIEEVAAKWDTWTGAQQNAIAQALAGKRQYNNLLALFDNWDMYTSALETSRNSIGTLQKQQDIYMESTAAHLQQLKTEWEDLYDSILDSKTINSALDGLTNILNLITNIVDSLGGGKTILMGLISLIGVKFSKQISNMFTPMIKNMQNAKNNAEVLQGLLKNIETQQQNGTITGRAAEAMANTQRQMSQYWSVMSEEQINASQEAIREIGEWETKKEKIEQSTKSLRNYITQLKNSSSLQKAVNSKELLNSGSAANSKVLNFLKSQSASVVEAQDSFNKLNKEAQNLNITIKATQGDTEKLGKINFSKFEKVLQSAKESVVELRAQANKGLIDEKVAEDAEEALKRIETRFEKIKNQTKQGYTVTFNKDMIKSLPMINGELDKTNVKYQEYITLLKEAGKTEQQAEEELNKIHQSLNINNLALEKRVQNISKLIGGLSSLVFAAQSLSNIGDILDNDDLTEFEKFSQIIISLSMGLPMLKAGLSAVASSFSSLITPIMMATLAEEGLVSANGQVTMSGAALVGSQEVEKVKVEEVTAAYLKQKLVKAMLTPVGIAFTLMVIATTGALIANIKAHEHEIKTIKEANEAYIETIKTKQEERKAYEDTSNSLQDLIDKYREGTVSQQEFNEQKADLLANLDAEGRAALNVSDNWEEATRSLSKYRSLLAEQTAEEAEESARLRAENALIAADKGVGKYDTSTQTFSNEDARNIRRYILGGLGGLSGSPTGRGIAFTANYLLDKDYNKSLSQIDFYLKDTKTKLDDIVDEAGNLQLDINNPQSIVDFVDAVDKATRAGVKLDESITKQASEIRSSGAYAELAADLATARTETEKKYGADSGIDFAETLEEGQAAYEQFTENLIKNEGYTLQEANDAWVKYLSGLDSEVATQMIDLQTDYDSMTSAFASKFQGDFNTSSFKAEADEVFKYLQDNDLTEGIHLFTPEEWEDMIIGDMSVEEIGRLVGEKLDESIRNGFEAFKEKAGENEDSLQSLLQEALSGDVDTSEKSTYAQIKNSLEDLLTYYPELQEQADIFNNEAIIGTEKWTNAVYALKDAYNDLDFAKKVDSYSEKLEKLNRQLEREEEGTEEVYKGTTGKYNERGQLETETETIELVPDTKLFTETVEDIMDADYAINIEIGADVEDGFNDIVKSMENVDSMADKIGEDFIVSAENITEVAEAFPGILEGYTDLGDGTIQLNEEIARSAMNAASDAEIASTEQFVTEAENANKTLQLNKNHYQTMLETAQKASKGEIDAAKAKTDIDAELNEIESINNDITAENATDNAFDVAEDSKTNAEAVSNNWEGAYSNMANASFEAAKTAIENARQVVQANKTGKGKAVQGKNLRTNWQGQTGKKTSIDTSTNGYKSSSNADKTDEEYFAEIASYAQQQIDAIDKEIAANEAMAVEAAARLGSSATKNSNVGKKTGSDSGSSGSEKEADHEDYLEHETDLYRAINEELDDIESTLGRIQKFDDHSWGLTAKKALEQENKLLKQQLDMLEKKKDTYERDLGARRGALESQGIIFSEDGSVMTNAEDKINQLYGEYNAMVDKYNAMSADDQESFKETLEAKKDSIDEIEDAIDKYEDGYNDYNSVLDELLDTHYELIENEVNHFNADIDVHLELDEAEQEWNDFWYEVVKDIEDEDFAGRIAQSVGKLNTLIGTVGKTRDSQVAELTDHLNEVTAEVRAQIAAATRGGEGSLFQDDSALSKENLENYRDQLMDAVRTAKEEIDEMADTYLEALDHAKDLIDDQVEGWEAIGDHIEHDLELIQMVSGDKAFDALNKQFEQQYKNNLQLIQTQRMSTEYWQERMKYYEQMMATEQEGSEMYKMYSDALETASENYRKAVSDLDKTVEDALKKLEEWRKNQVAEITDSLDKALSKNMGLEDLKKQWDLVVEEQDYYLDNVERAIEMEGLQNEFDDVLNAMDARGAKQQEFLKWQDEELRKLNEKNKLTQYDIDEVKARLELKRQELALEEAQQNKSNLRLRRDSQGNYTYQYVADEGNVEDAEDKMLTAKREWYELVKKRNEETTNEVIDIRKRLLEAENEMAEALAAHNDEAYENAKARYEFLIEYEKELMEEGEKAKRDFYSGTAEFFADVNDNQILPMWDTTIQQMINKWDNGGKDSFIGATISAIGDLEEVQRQFGNHTEEILYTAGVNYQDLVERGIDPTTEALEDMQDSNDVLNVSLEETNDLMNQLADELMVAIDAYNSLKDAAVNAIREANDALETLARTAIQTSQQVQSAIAAAQRAANVMDNLKAVANSRANGDGGSGPYGSSTNNKQAKVYSVGSYTRDKNDYESYYVSVNGRQYGQYIRAQSAGDAAKLIDEEWLRRYGLSGYEVISGYATGGYTGEWNNGSDNGRLAILHQKELVLNESDTTNILNAVKAVRDIVSAQASPNFSGIADSIANMAAMQASAFAQIGSSMLSAIASSVNNNNSDVSNYRNMTVNADFSGVRSADAIYQALRELENYGAQQAYSSAPHANSSY